MEEGSRIREARIRAGMTQHELADGICADSTLSRIESGGRSPSPDVLQRLRERLTEAGSLLRSGETECTEQAAALEQEILRSLLCLDFERLGEQLWCHESLCGTDPLRLQFRKFASLIWEEMRAGTAVPYGEDRERDMRVRKKCLDILRLSRPDLADDTFAGEIGKEHLSHTEMLLLNVLSILSFSGGQMKRGVSVVTGLLSLAEQNPRDTAAWHLLHGGLEVNLGWMDLMMGFSEKARQRFRIAACDAWQSGGVQLVLHAVEGEKEYARRSGDQRLYWDAARLSAGMRELLPAAADRQNRQGITMMIF